MSCPVLSCPPRFPPSKRGLENLIYPLFKEENKITIITNTFPVDDTPTPTKILRMANDLFPDFQDPKENPFDVHFRKAAEAVKSGRKYGCQNKIITFCSGSDPFHLIWIRIHIRKSRNYQFKKKSIKNIIKSLIFEE